jgi:hypothetical protein
MMAKKEKIAETWIIDEPDGTIIEFDDVVFGERDADLNRTMTCFWKGKVVYSGKMRSFSRRDAWEWWQERKKEDAAKTEKNQ